MEGNIAILKARENNLKGIDVNIPWHKITVITGLSGSGKSSLALDTLYSEGLRRYVECLSTYARQFFERVQRPQMDDIKGLPPVIAVFSRNNVRHSRSTVGTTTEIYDYLRLLFAKIGIIHCPSCGVPVTRSTPETIVDTLFKETPNEKVILTFRPHSTDLKPESLLSNGYTRIYTTDGLSEVEELDELPTDYEIVVDRVEVKQKNKSRLIESIENAFSENNKIYFHSESQHTLAFSNKLECPTCPDMSFSLPTPLLFSFNSPQGACEECNGFGDILDIDPELIIPNEDLSLEDGAVAPLTAPSLKRHLTKMLAFAENNGADINIPYKKLPKKFKEMLFNGGDGFPGIKGIFRRLERKSYKLHIRVFLSKYRSGFACPTCAGSRINNSALFIKLAGKTIYQLTEMPVSELKGFFEDFEPEGIEAEIASELLKQLRARIGYLSQVGLDYVTLARATKTLSGGEAQRVSLGCQLGSRLTETLYIMDEPSVGLHQRDIDRLISILEELRDRDNTVVVVEHDTDIMRASDYIVELGPKAGENGGRIVFKGETSDFINGSNGSITKKYLTGELSIEYPSRRRRSKSKLKITGASENNLKDIDVEFPLGTLCSVTGVSGSGKSSLIHNILYKSLTRMLNGGTEKPGKHKKLLGTNKIEGVVLLDQSPIGRNSRSNPITYIKAFDELRKALAATPQAKQAGMTPSYFSFNVPGGRCEECNGEGELKIDMHFLADVKVLCDQCQGKRFRDEVLKIKYKGKNIDEILGLTINEALKFFGNIPVLSRKLKILDDVGLGYLTMGQPAPTLSAGEAQRIKIAKELGRKDGRGIVYILDEPTVGLHLDDINKLLAVLNKLVDGGNTVIVVEHNLEFIKASDYIIDLGPEGGGGGGYLVAKGTPEEVSLIEDSFTGQYLRKSLEPRNPTVN